jgi:hypothetical protein
MLPKHTTCPAFAQSITVKNISDMLDSSPPLRRAQKLSCAAQRRPEAASRRIALSSSASARSRFSRAFSFSRSFSRFAWSIRSPPNFFFQR